MSHNNSRRRWLQFSLKGLLIALTVAALVIGRTVSRVRNQEAIVATVADLGGQVWSADDKPKFAESWLNPDRLSAQTAAKTNWVRQTLGDEYFRDVAQIDLKLRSIDEQSQLALSQLAPRLRNLPRLETLKLEFAMSNDKLANEFLGNLDSSQLKYLYIDGLITDVSIEHVSKVSSLEALKLTYTQVTDKGALHLKQLKKLRKLFLYSSELSETGVNSVMALPQLEQVMLYDCNITESRFSEIAKQYPELNAELFFTQKRMKAN